MKFRRFIWLTHIHIRVKIYLYIKNICIIFFMNVHCLTSSIADDLATSLSFLACSYLLFLIHFNMVVQFFYFRCRNYKRSQFKITTKRYHSRNLKAVDLSSLVQLHAFILSSSWRKKNFLRCDPSPGKTTTITLFWTLLNAAFTDLLLHFSELEPHISC